VGNVVIVADGHYAGLSSGDRAARRAEILDRKLDEARRKAAELGRSTKCGRYNWHAGQPGGCGNDGSGCICECHDPLAEVEATA
jgi:hypothetical protein